MLRDQPTIVPGIYFLPEDPVGAEILVPGFRESVSVRGAFGWFSAGWIARLAPGLIEFLRREDVRPIELTVAPEFYPEELEASRRGIEMSAEQAAERIAQLFTRNPEGVSALARHAVKCLSWMIAAKRLQLRVAVPQPHSNYHPKMWLFDDGQDQVLAHGSANATGHGVESGVEHINVDVSWLADGREKVRKGGAQLHNWAIGRSAGISRVVELSDALLEGIVRTAPRLPPSFEDYRKAVEEDGGPGWAADSDWSIRARFRETQSASRRPRLKIPEWLRWQEGAYAHQGEAVAAWEATEWPHRGTLSMATGSGKTLTALVCAARAQEKLENKPFAIVISAPSNPLIKQWREEVSKFGIRAVAPNMESDRDVALTRVFRSLGAGGTHILVVTNNLLCKEEFKSTLRKKLKALGATSLLIGDEAHTLGAKGFCSNPPDFFDARLALSATPVRQYDPDGTEQIFEFFGPTVYEFGIDRAIGLCLVPYDYFVHAATLDEDEVEEFQRITQSIGKLIGRRNDEEHDESHLNRLLIRRRRIVETTKAKLALLRRVLQVRGPREIEHTLIYASSKNPQQFNKIGEILDDLNIRWAPVTQETTANPRSLARTFEAFTGKGFQVLLAKKVLDEGVDIPSVREAFIVASSRVEREWIQRRGRVLRTQSGKSFAVVHDFLGLPPARIVRGKRDRSLKRLVGSELGRALAFAQFSKNALGERGVIDEVQKIRSIYWPSGAPVRGAELDGPGSLYIANATPRGKLC